MVATAPTSVALFLRVASADPISVSCSVSWFEALGRRVFLLEVFDRTLRSNGHFLASNLSHPRLGPRLEVRHSLGPRHEVRLALVVFLGPRDEVLLLLHGIYLFDPDMIFAPPIDSWELALPASHFYS